jgi:hypothetical protein
MPAYDFCVGFDEDGLPPARRELAGGGRGRARERESDFLDPRRLTGLIEDRFGPSCTPCPAVAGQSNCDERPFYAATGSNGLPNERGPAKIEHVIESRFRLLLIFRHEARMTEADASGVDKARRERRVSRMELACRHAAGNYLFEQQVHAMVVRAHGRPVFGHRGFDQLVQLSVQHVLFVKCLFDGRDQVSHSLEGGAARHDDFSSLGFDLAEEFHADSLVDFGFCPEEAIDIRRRHAQLACYIGDRRLLETELPEEPFRYFDYQATRIPSLGFFFSGGFSFSSHVLIIPSSIGGTMILARVRRFPQMGLETDILFLSVT